MDGGRRFLLAAFCDEGIGIFFALKHQLGIAIFFLRPVRTEHAAGECGIGTAAACTQQNEREKHQLELAALFLFHGFFGSFIVRHWVILLNGMLTDQA